MIIFEDFMFWIMSIMEDHPIPYEVKHLYFVISFNTGICSLVFVGTENFESPLTSFEYYPLEAQWFSSNTFHEIKEITLAKVTVKELIEKAFENSFFKREFTSKNIHICQRGEPIVYTYST